MHTIKPCLPTDLTDSQFLSNYWQKKPLLIRQGLSSLLGLFEPQDVMALATEPEVSARLLTETVADTTNTQGHDLNQSHWQLKTAPFTKQDFLHLPEQYSVLIQNMEQWSPLLGSLWQAFDFIPQWQRDDIMVSYAPAGGSVGAHFDQYDVFLAQGFGQRRWQLGQYCDQNSPMVADQPIRLLTDMGEITFDEVLQPGDVLYVPPFLAHHGVALDDCLTFSFGFRQPNLLQLFDALTEVATQQPALFSPLSLTQPSQHGSAELTHDTINQLHTAIQTLLTSDMGHALLTQAAAETLSKRQYPSLISEDQLEEPDIVALLQAGAVVRLDHNSRLLYVQGQGQPQLYANGQCLDTLSKQQRVLLVRLADGQALNAADLEQVPPAVLLDWLQDGWVWLDDTAL